MNLIKLKVFSTVHYITSFYFAEIGNLVAMATDSLQSGKVIAVPTDTIYGIAALVQNSEAVDRMYNIKNRDYSKPVAISVAEIKDIYRYMFIEYWPPPSTDLKLHTYYKC